MRIHTLMCVYTSVNLLFGHKEFVLIQPNKAAEADNVLTLNPF